MVRTKWLEEGNKEGDKIGKLWRRRNGRIFVKGGREREERRGIKWVVERWKGNEMMG